jgi:hypothetical protein
MINDLGLALLGVQDPKQEKPASRRRTEWIQTALTAKAPKAAISFTVDSKEITKRLASGKQLYRFTIHPDRNTLPSGPDAVDAITYMADHPSFNRRMLVGRAEKGYAASYVGWGCLSKIVALIAYADPHRQPERTTFDGCPPHWRGD